MKKIRVFNLLVCCALMVLSLTAAKRKDVVTIFMIGDSTMANKPIDKGNQERGYGSAVFLR